MGRITGVRGDTVVRTPPLTEEQIGNSAEVAQAMMANELVNLAAKTIDLSRPVDEYIWGAGASAAAPWGLEVFPDYEMDEIITSILITAPAAATVTLELGSSYQLALVVPASAYILLSPIQMRLSRNDRRTITLGSAGICSLRLMGYADMQGSIGGP